MNTIDDYLNIITSEHRGKPNFAATISAVVAPLVQIQTLLESMIELFDLDLPPVGNQLDIIGQWVGVSRNVSIPLTGIFFSWDDTTADGWDFGFWQDPSAGSITVLPDDIYLTVIQAKIALNSWDGTTRGLYKVWDSVVTGYKLLIQDNQDMTFLAVIQGAVPDSLTQALFTGGYLIPRPEGIRISEYVIPVDTNPIFAWDCDSSSLAGWDVGSWGALVAGS